MRFEVKSQQPDGLTLTVNESDEEYLDTVDECLEKIKKYLHVRFHNEPKDVGSIIKL